MPRHRHCVTLLGGVMVLFVTAGSSLAIPDWRKDGRLGYPSRDLAVQVAREFTAPGAPREGHGYRIRRDPDGGFTPIFLQITPLDGAGA